MPLILQAEAAECGLACLGMISAYHGYDSDLVSLRRRFSVSLRGATLSTIVDIASRLGLGSRALRCEMEDLQKLRLPAILHWNMNHFVVLTKVSSRAIEIRDPASGHRRISIAEAGKSFTGVAVELTPKADFTRKVEKAPLGLSKLVRVDGTLWKAVGQALLLSVFLQVFVLLGPYYMQLVVDDAILRGNLSLLVAIAAGFLVLQVFEAATVLVRGLVLQFISSVLSFDMRASLFGHLVRLPLPYFHKRQMGDVQQRFQSLAPIQFFLTNGAISSLIDGVLAMLLGIIIFLYDATLALVVVGFVALNASLRLAFLSLSKRLAEDQLAASAQEQSKFLETLRAMQAIKVAGSEAEREALWRNFAARTINAQIRFGNLNIGYNATSGALLGISNVVVIYIAATNAIAGTMTIGMITAFVAYKGQFESRLMALLDQFIQFRLLDVHLSRVSDIALQEPENTAGVQDAHEDVTGRVALRDVRFSYSEFDPEVLSGIDLDIEPGEYIAIAAPSGAGKSTLLRLLVGLYRPTSGQILVDGFDIAKGGIQSVRKHIGAVMQDDSLLAGTIEENISFFDHHPDNERIRWAAQAAAIHDDIKAMPMGYKTLVGDMGTSLSGGQLQRVVLARALYRHPKILVMDEGTSALDIATEMRVNSALREMKITRIIAAHRPETLAAADRVVVLRAGKIVKTAGDLVPNMVQGSPENA